MHGRMCSTTSNASAPSTRASYAGDISAWLSSRNEQCRLNLPPEQLASGRSHIFVSTLIFGTFAIMPRDGGA